jgi:hypothetical protein
MTFYAFDMREISQVFIKFAAGGTFKMEDCVLRIAEPFAEWVSETNSWNATFVHISLGTFEFKKVDFSDITVNREGSCVVYANISSSKTCTIDGCKFGGGCLGNGNVIYIESNSLPLINSTIINNTIFLSCFGYNGGVFKYNKN